MIMWKKYNGALIPQNPPHIKIDVNSSVLNKKIKEEGAFLQGGCLNLIEKINQIFGI